MYFCCESRTKPRKILTLKKSKQTGEYRPKYDDEEYDLPILCEVSVNVKSCSISQIDIDKVFRPKSYPKIGDNHILGCDFSGIVKDIGSKVTKFQKGDYVYGIVKSKNEGTWAETLVIEEKYLCKIPLNLGIYEAGTVPYSAIIAYKLLFDILKLQSGEKILIHDACIDEGFYAIQLAKLRGAYVYASTRQLELQDELKKYDVDEIGEYWNGKECGKIKFKYAIDFTYESKNEVKFYKYIQKNENLLVYLDQTKYENIMKNNIIPGFHYQIDFYPEDLEKVNELIADGKLDIRVRDIYRFTNEENPITEYSGKGIGKRMFIIDERLTSNSIKIIKSMSSSAYIGSNFNSSITSQIMNSSMPNLKV